MARRWAVDDELAGIANVLERMRGIAEAKINARRLLHDVILHDVGVGGRVDPAFYIQCGHNGDELGKYEDIGIPKRSYFYVLCMPHVSLYKN